MKHIGAVGQAEFLRWINEAKCVVTNSFHVTAFSIIFNTPFFVETEIERNDRVLNLLDIFDLAGCGLKKGETSDGVIEIPHIEWNTVNEKLEIERRVSLRYIDEIMD